MFWLLMRTKLLGTKNVILQTCRQRPLAAITMTMASLALFGAMFEGFWILLTFAERFQILDETIYQVFYYFFLLLFAGAVPFVAATLFQSADYSLLFAAPIPPRTVVAAKLLDATVTNSAQFTIIGLPAIVASASVLHLSPFGWIVALLLILLFVLFPVLLTALALLLALAMVGIERLRAAITLINVLMGIAVCITFVLEAKNLPFKYGVTGSFQPDLHNISPAAHQLPCAWFASAMVGLAVGKSIALHTALRFVLQISLLCLLLFATCMLLGGKLLSASSLGDNREGHGSVRPSGDWANKIIGLLRSTFGGPMTALLVKDVRYLWRDNMMLSQLTVPMILFLVPYLIGYQNRAMSPKTELYPFSVVIVTFILFIQTSIISLSLLGMEGEGFWMALEAPFQRQRVLWAKWILSTFASAGVAILLGLIGGITFQAEPAWIVVECLVILLWSAGLCGLGVGISALFPRFIHENPAIRVSPWALIVGFFATMGYMVLSFTLIIFLWILFQGLQSPTLAWPLVLGGLLALTLLTVIVVAIAMGLGGKRIEGYEWQH